MNEPAKHIVINTLEELKKRIADNIVSTKRNASGRTAESLRIEEKADGATLFGRFPFATLETGRKPGKTPKGFVGIILQWMKDKSLKGDPIPYLRTPSDRWQPKHTPKERGNLSMAGAIAHKIKTEGTLLHREGTENNVYSNEIPKTILEIHNQLLGIYKEEIKSIKLN